MAGDRCGPPGSAGSPIWHRVATSLQVVIIWYYARYMNKLDIEHNVHEED